jgi:guanine nucleotide-binding protein subunit alpha
MDHIRCWRLSHLRKCFHPFIFPTSHPPPARRQRHAWLPYFENINAIIFLAPISCFDEPLLEDPRVNRLEDSLVLWKAICASKLLRGTTMVVFLNKCDLLMRKLSAGVKFAKFWGGYAGPNEVAGVTKCEWILLCSWEC